MTEYELKCRRLHAQHLLSPTEPLSAAGGLCGLQAQFLRNAVHALRIRSDTAELAGLVKTWTLRGTVHLLPERDLPLYLRHCGTAEDVCMSGWYRWRTERGGANPPERERMLARLLTEAVANGIDEREALRTHLRACGMTAAEEAHAFDPWGGLIRELAEIGVLAFQIGMADDTHPAEQKRYRLLRPFTPLAEDAAQEEIARRYLLHYGPATLRDAAYFLHWTQAEIRKAFERTGAVTADCAGRRFYSLPGAVPVEDIPPVVLLAGFDPLMLGYRKEDNPFLPQEHLRGIFSLAGIVHPAILLKGRVVGRWKEAKGKVELTPFEPLQPADQQLIAGEAERLFTIRKMVWT